MTYSAGDFEGAYLFECGKPGAKPLLTEEDIARHQAVLVAALKIAAAVQREGVIEAAIGEQFGRLAPSANAAVIRKALMEGRAS